MIRNNEAVRNIPMNIVGIGVHAASMSTDELRQHVFDEARSRRFQDHDFNADEAPIIISPVKSFEALEGAEMPLRLCPVRESAEEKFAGYVKA